ncbi:hypothetical protein AXG93_632s1070 [Marchantia polymorpha subsp. ruderalis]|uniref:Uncharacterized protein n=1 Tax=Marchantia polymorpha subsp. ruderalis TaxID=1480154 RepID=A0A176WHQ2_MARPO|nr:hypothetical protein AXG93_632s1070 [Marchantia polymorpha subsp. ruderalis]
MWRFAADCHAQKTPPRRRHRQTRNVQQRCCAGGSDVDVDGHSIDQSMCRKDITEQRGDLIQSLEKLRGLCGMGRNATYD